MNSITVIEKPDYISYDVIHDILYKAHETNRTKYKFTIKTAEMSGTELKEHLGSNGKCFVAMNGQKVIGTISIRTQVVKHWCTKGEVIELAMIGILPEYRGQRVFPMLYDEAMKNAINSGIKYIEIRTADKNHKMQKIAELNGFKYIDFNPVGRDHYTVIMLKWIDGCPYSAAFIKIRYLIKKVYTIIRYRPGWIKRFGI